MGFKCLLVPIGHLSSHIRPTLYLRHSNSCQQIRTKMVHVKGLGVSTRFSHCRIHGALYLEPIICIDLLLYMSRNHCTCSTNMCFWGIPNHSHHRNEQYLLFRPPRPKAPHPPDPPHKLQLLPPRIHPGRRPSNFHWSSVVRWRLLVQEISEKVCRSRSFWVSLVAENEGFVPGWRMVKISCKMPKFESWRLMFPETATKDWSIAWNYTIHGSFFGIEGLYLFISFTRFVHWRNLFCLTPLPPAKAPFLNAAWTL